MSENTTAKKTTRKSSRKPVTMTPDEIKQVRAIENKPAIQLSRTELSLLRKYQQYIATTSTARREHAEKFYAFAFVLAKENGKITADNKEMLRLIADDIKAGKVTLTKATSDLMELLFPRK
jgi:hypothetical protein